MGKLYTQERCVSMHMYVYRWRDRERDGEKKNETERAKTVRESPSRVERPIRVPLRCLEVSSCYFERSCSCERLQAANPSAAAGQSGCRVHNSRAPASESGFELAQRGRSAFARDNVTRHSDVEAFREVSSDRPSEAERARNAISNKTRSVQRE